MRRTAPWTGVLAATVALAALAAAGCSGGGYDDVMNPPPPDDPEAVELHYDAANDNSPNLPAATYRAGARFPPSETADLADGELTQVRFYLWQVPSSCKVKIYGEGTADTPGAELYSADVTGSVAANQWNTHTLASPVDIPDGDLWIAIEFVQTPGQPAIGCDAGPAAADGDWLYSSADADWKTFRDRFVVSINWNVRGVVEVP